MKNKKFWGITAALAVTVLAGGSLAIFAAETAAPDAEVIEAEPETAALVTEEAESAVPDVEVVEAEPETAAPIAEEADPETVAPVAEETEPAVPDVEVVEAEPETAAPVAEETEPAVSDAEAVGTEPAVPDEDYSYHVGQQSSTARNDAYAALPEGGTKEEAEEFYETYEVGGGAWADGAYDESLKSGYGYAEGQQRAAQYAQDGDDDEEYKAGYSYSTGRQNYMENYPNYRK